jgi:HSP20 family protein
LAQSLKEIAMANITRYSPFEDLFSDFTKGFWVKPLAFPAETDVRMKVDVQENDKAFTVHAEIPGVKKDDIQVDINGNVVSIRAEMKQEKEEKKGDKVIYSERSYGMASRSLSLPGDVDSQGASASYKDGVLDLTLPKKASAQSKHLTIQ